MRIFLALFASVLLVGPWGPADAASEGGHGSVRQPAPKIDVRQALVGNTIAVRAHMPQSEPKDQPGRGAESVKTLIFMAWLGSDGTARVRVWDQASGRDRPVQTTRYTIEGDVLCLNAPDFGLAGKPLCTLMNIIGPRAFFAEGVGLHVMVRGDIRPGNQGNL
ncbi:MAG: hypothetical protein EXQ87_02775 [Alphaproteobacteria bacterium]|nr:hypothetical protein [Alphaproteobacteria bacterium]